MGFSMIFVRTAGDDQIDGDREAVGAFLAGRGLRVVANDFGSALVHADGSPLQLDGSVTDLHLDPLDQLDPLSGGIDHATFAPEETAFIVDLCAAAGFLVVNPQGAPTYVVVRGNHRAVDVPDPDDVAWIEDADELAAALSGNFDAFRDFRRRVLGT